MTPEDRPLFRIGGNCHHGYEVTVCTGENHPTMTYYGEPCELITTIAHTKTFEAALAVLRLHDVRGYHDWTQAGAHWGMPLSVLEPADGRPEGK